MGCSRCGAQLEPGSGFCGACGQPQSARGLASPEPPVVSLAPFWSFFEIVGVVAALAPFAIRMSSSSLETVNGHVTHFVYRDWLAAIGGAIAIACGLGAAARFRSTLPARRALRAVVVLALLGLGAFQLVRGLGLTQSPPAAEQDHVAFSAPADDPLMKEATQNARGSSAAAQPAIAKPPVDLEGPMRTVFDLWQSNKPHELYAMATPALQKAAGEEKLGDLLAVVNAAAGPCTPWTPPASYAIEDGQWKGHALVQCGKVHVRLDVDFDIQAGKLLIDGVNMTNPEAVDKDPDDADAVALAKRTLDALVAADTSHFAEDFDPRMLKNLGPLDQVGPALKNVLADAGTITGIEQVESTPSKNEHHFTFDVAAKKHHLEITLGTHFVLTRWFVSDFNVAPAETKPKKTKKK